MIRKLSRNDYDVTVVSPRNHFVFTPLLASTAVGTLEFRCVVEPVHLYKVDFYEARCQEIDFKEKKLLCSSALESFKDNFTIDYDTLIIATGAESNTFGIPGVKEHAMFLKDVSDARRIRSRILECFEHASQPNVTDEERRAVLHFAVVGGGPTGVEFMAELHDFVTEDVLRVYPKLLSFVRMTVFDVAPRILGSFDGQLSQYASKRFTRKGIRLRLGARVKSVERHQFTLDDGEEVPYGLLVWSTGLTQIELVKSLDGQVAKDPAMKRIVTDNYCRVLQADGKPMHHVYALGDCATTKGINLPCTAQVANQKAAWLGKALNTLATKFSADDYTAFLPNAIPPFEYHHQGSLAYIGKWRAIVDTKSTEKAKEEQDGTKSLIPSTGVAAWL
ncbi:hypothetical protein HK101_003472, partial [Irineochytrium annulatum]